MRRSAVLSLPFQLAISYVTIITPGLRQPNHNNEFEKNYCKHSSRWHHLSQSKVKTFCSLQKNAANATTYFQDWYCHLKRNLESCE